MSKQNGDDSAFGVAAGYRPLSADKEHTLNGPVCPYCGGKLRFSINGCELDEATGAL